MYRFPEFIELYDSSDSQEMRISDWVRGALCRKEAIYKNIFYIHKIFITKKLV